MPLVLSIPSVLYNVRVGRSYVSGDGHHLLILLRGFIVTFGRCKLLEALLFESIRGHEDMHSKLNYTYLDFHIII